MSLEETKKIHFVQFLTEKELKGLTPRQIQMLTAEQVQMLSHEQIQMLTHEQIPIQSLPSASLVALTPTQIMGLFQDKDFLRKLSKEQRKELIQYLSEE